jgi:hypothetical protein
MLCCAALCCAVLMCVCVCVCVCVCCAVCVCVCAVCVRARVCVLCVCVLCAVCCVLCVCVLCVCVCVCACVGREGGTRSVRGRMHWPSTPSQLTQHSRSSRRSRVQTGSSPTLRVRSSAPNNVNAIRVSSTHVGVMARTSAQAHGSAAERAEIPL